MSDSTSCEDALRSLCADIIRIEWDMWRPIQCFRSDEEVARDEAKHEMASMIADKARAALAESGTKL